MFKEKISFYSPVDLKTYNLDPIVRYQLNILERFDPFTRRHSENVGNLCCRICEALHCTPAFTVYCMTCGYLHDIGKVFIPPEIINKPSRLTDEEYEVIKSHTTLGYNLCIKEPKLRPYALGALNHHEALDGSGYPNGITKKDIPYEAQIIRVADEYDALVTKRQYKTHVNISETLKDLIKDAQPDPKFIALDQLAGKKKTGKVNGTILKTLFKVVIDDILYEISSTMDYIEYLKQQIKRLEVIESYSKKAEKSNKEKTKDYYYEGMRLLFQDGETFETWAKTLEDYRIALQTRNEVIKNLHLEIKIVKNLKV